MTKNLSNTAKLLRDLVALPSVNPAFLSPGDPHAGEEAVADFLADTFKRAGLDVTFQTVKDSRANLIVQLKPRGKPKRRLILAPHLDTVGVQDEAMFNPRIQQDRLHGRGACDTKGSVAAMAQALLDISRNGNAPEHTTIMFAGLVDEENGQSGSRALTRRKLKADLAIVGEPTQLKVVTAHKGNRWLSLTTRGKAAHGSRPELGANAIHRMARIVDLLETEYAERLTQKRHPLLGSPTINVGTISGGLQPNIVPAECRVQIDRRTLPGPDSEQVFGELRRFLREHGFHARLDAARAVTCPPLETEPRLPLIRQFLKLTKQKEPAGVDFFCDAAILALGGIPSIVFGPGNIAQAHTADEWISLRSLDRGTALLTRFLTSLP